MATQSQRPPRDVVEFAPNVPVTVALKYNQGRRCNSQYGERMMYSTTDGRVMFLDIETAAQVEALGINVGESFSVTRKWNEATDSPATWEISRVLGEQPNGTFLVPAGDATTGGAVRKPAGSSTRLLLLKKQANNRRRRNSSVVNAQRRSKLVTHRRPGVDLSMAVGLTACS
jgi:hypothetical protein